MIPLLVTIGISAVLVYCYVKSREEFQSATTHCDVVASTNKNSKKVKIYSANKCRICHDPLGMRTNQEPLVLKCGHMYHKSCLGDLIKNDHTKCPDCRADIEIYNEDE